MKAIQPRILRFGQAYGYLGMSKGEFNKTVRPHVREFPIGEQGVGFDRLELDAWADAYIERMAIEKPERRRSNARTGDEQGQAEAPPKPRRRQPAPHADGSKAAFQKALKQAKKGKPAG